MVSSVTPSTISLANLLLLHYTGHSQHEIAWIKLSGFCRDIYHLLNFRNYLIRLAVVLFMVHATVETRKRSQRDMNFDIIKFSPFSNVEYARPAHDHRKQFFLETLMTRVLHRPVPIVIIIRTKIFCTRLNLVPSRPVESHSHVVL